MDIFTVSFFGHRDFYFNKRLERGLKEILVNLLDTKPYIDFKVGRNGEFDQFVSTTLRQIKREYGYNNFSHILVLPYLTAEYRNNEKSFNEYYDDIEICEKSDRAFYKASIQIRNREMVNSSDLVICYIEREYGGAYQTVVYAKNNNVPVINLKEYQD